MYPMPIIFQLIGQRLDFVLVNRYLAAGFIPAVYGRTLDGKRQTCARVEDVIFMPIGM